MPDRYTLGMTEYSHAWWQPQAHEDRRPFLLGRNRITRLRLLQTGSTPDWWSIDELSLWERVY